MVMKPDNSAESFEEEVRRVLAEKAVIWDRGLKTAYGPEGGYHSLPSEDAFEGEIFRGRLSGCRLIVDRVEFKGKVNFIASVDSSRIIVGRD
jgi:hypothetical protein